MRRSRWPPDQRTPQESVNGRGSQTVAGSRHALKTIAAVLGAAGWLVFAAPVRAEPPSFESVRAAWTISEGSLLDRNGVLLQQRRLDPNVRRLAWTPLDGVSPALVRALLAAEDRRFFTHGGVDARAIAGAVWPLSMQLAALLDPALGTASGRRSWRQKFAQMGAAIELERSWSKHQILEAYLNRVGFRGEVQGIRAASQRLFGKDPSGLSEAESLLIAAVLPAPNRDPQRVSDKACAIARSGSFATPCDELRDLALHSFERPALHATSGDAPHLAKRLLIRPGQSIATTLDAHLQRAALQSLQVHLRALVSRNVRDGAAVVVDNATGDVLAYVASGGPYSRSPEVDGVLARRQAGSTLKPFLYGLALERRYLTAASLLDDTPVHLETTTGLYIPQNYDREFKGTVSVRTALAGSLNVPAVRTLALVGVRRFRDRLYDLGYRGLNEDGDYYGYSLALGSAEVSLLEQVNAYRTLANSGVFSPLRLRPDEAIVPPRPVLPAAASFIVADILADRAGRAITFGLDNPLTTRYWSAVKTGTSKEMRDNWCIGFTRRYTVGVWVGNFEGDPMRDVSGIAGAAPVWLELMDELQAEDGSGSDMPQPVAGLERRTVRFEPPLEPPRAEWFLAGTETTALRRNPEEQRRPRIASPPNGVVIALDPDVPGDRQSVFFIAQAVRPGTWFQLDGQKFATADQPGKWLPLPGRHRLVLRAADGKQLDAVDFSVRRPRMAGQDRPR